MSIFDDDNPFDDLNAEDELDFEDVIDTAEGWYDEDWDEDD